MANHQPFQMAVADGLGRFMFFGEGLTTPNGKVEGQI
jgi:hypothetical protein